MYNLDKITWIDKLHCVGEIIDENMPRFVSETERILNRNRYLEGRVTYMFNELIDIKQYANVGDIESILVLLSKYNLNKKLEL